MKAIVFTVLLAFLFIASHGQDSTRIGKIVEVKEGADKTEVGVFNDRIHIEDNYHGDTTFIRIGKRKVEVVEKDGNTSISMHRDHYWDDKYDRKKDRKFNGHWAAFELGVNGFRDADYSMVEGDGFMDLDQPKSLEVNINFMEYNIALKEHSIGLVTGMGWTMNNYKFDNQVTIDKGDDGIIVPLEVDADGFKKSKLTVSYLTVPLLLEFQVPVNGRSNQLFVSGGVIGGINLGSHTKVKDKDSKSKDRGSFNIEPFKYALTARVGLKDINLYANYSLSPLFKEDKGPELFPFTIGISLVNF
jgi:hypothetical protein